MRDRLNAPIEYDRAVNGYRFGKPRSGPRYELPGLWFNAAEIHALLSTLQLLGNLQPGLLDGQVEPLVGRLRQFSEEAITRGRRSKSASASSSRAAGNPRRRISAPSRLPSSSACASGFVTTTATRIA